MMVSWVIAAVGWALAVLYVGVACFVERERRLLNKECQKHVLEIDGLKEVLDLTEAVCRTLESERDVARAELETLRANQSQEPVAITFGLEEFGERTLEIRHASVQRRDGVPYATVIWRPWFRWPLKHTSGPTPLRLENTGIVIEPLDHSSEPIPPLP